MAVWRQDGPYVWVTWLTKLLVGENSCEWSAWFKACHEGWSWEKQPSTFDTVSWQMDHSSEVALTRRGWEEQGYVVFTEEQNSFVLRGRSAKLAGKPDLIVKRGNDAIVVDVRLDGRFRHTVSKLCSTCTRFRDPWVNIGVSSLADEWSIKTMKLKYRHRRLTRSLFLT